MPRIFGRQTSPSFILNDNMTSTSLDARAEIDVIDEQLVDLLASRFRATAQVGIVKKELDLPPVDAAREARQSAAHRALAERHGLAPEFIVSLFRVIIDEVVSHHRRV